jgi:hypothetical protein
MLEGAVRGAVHSFREVCHSGLDPESRPPGGPIFHLKNALGMYGKKCLTRCTRRHEGRVLPYGKMYRRIIKKVTELPAAVDAGRAYVLVIRWISVLITTTSPM